jgi:hypothetical protein
MASPNVVTYALWKLRSDIHDAGISGIHAQRRPVGQVSVWGCLGGLCEDARAAGLLGSTFAELSCIE